MFGSEELDTTGDITRSEKSSTIHNGKSPMHGPNLWPDPEVLPEGWRASLESDWSTMLGGARTLRRLLLRPSESRRTCSMKPCESQPRC